MTLSQGSESILFLQSSYRLLRNYRGPTPLNGDVCVGKETHKGGEASFFGKYQSYVPRHP